MTSLPTFQQLVRLFRLAQHLREGDDLRPDDRAALANALAAYLSGAAPDIDSAMGLKLSPGERDWRTVSALAQRDEILRTAASRFYSGSPSAQADAMARDLRHYAASGWRHERIHDICPARHQGKKGELLWRVLKARDYVLTPRAIRSILARS